MRARQLSRAERAGPGGRQLHGKRDPVQPGAQGADLVGTAIAGASPDLVRPHPEQLLGVVLGQHRDGDQVFGAHARRPAAGHQDRQVGSHSEQPVQQRAHPDHLLDVVE